MSPLSARSYRLAWVGATSAVGGVGLLAGVVLLGSWPLLMILATATCLAVACRAAAADLADRHVRLLPVLVAVAAVLVAVTGLVVALGGAAVALLCCLALTGIPLVGMRYRVLDTAGLHARWAAGGAALAGAATPVEAAAVLRDRARCLDELERRDPDGFRRGLSSTDPFGALWSSDQGNA